MEGNGGWVAGNDGNATGCCALSPPTPACGCSAFLKGGSVPKDPEGSGGMLLAMGGWVLGRRADCPNSLSRGFEGVAWGC